jgi:hypothetical protein
VLLACSEVFDAAEFRCALGFKAKRVQRRRSVHLVPCGVDVAKGGET